MMALVLSVPRTFCYIYYYFCSILSRILHTLSVASWSGRVVGGPSVTPAYYKGVGRRRTSKACRGEVGFNIPLQQWRKYLPEQKACC